MHKHHDPCQNGHSRFRPVRVAITGVASFALLTACAQQEVVPLNKKSGYIQLKCDSFVRTKGDLKPSEKDAYILLGINEASGKANFVLAKKETGEQLGNISLQVKPLADRLILDGEDLYGNSIEVMRANGVLTFIVPADPSDRLKAKCVRA